LTNYLGIPKGLEFNYDVDNKRFNEKVNDQKILGIIDDIKKCFRISGNKYTDFNKEDGYERLNKMAISICKLFGNDILVSNLSSYKNNSPFRFRYLNII
jgi:hypothetical protein